MALLKPANFEDLDKALVTSYNEVFKRTQSNVADLVTVNPIGTSNFVHAFMTCFPKYRTWVGERVVNSLKIEEIAGKVERRELTVEIAVEDMLSDVLSPLIGQLGQLGFRAATLKDELVTEFLENGTSTDTKYLNYDALALFTSAHVRDGSLSDQSNNNTSQALDAANLIESFEQMMALTDEGGRPLGIMPTHIIVPSALYLTAVALIENPVAADGSTNTMHGRLKVVHLPELASATTWFLVSNHNGATPFMSYELESPKDTLLSEPSDHNVFWSDSIVYGSTARMAIKAAPWFLLQRNIA